MNMNTAGGDGSDAGAVSEAGTGSLSDWDYRWENKSDAKSVRSERSSNSGSRSSRSHKSSQSSSGHGGSELLPIFQAPPHHKDGVRGLTMFALLLMLAGVTAGCVYAGWSMYDDRHRKYHRKPLQSIKDIMSDSDKFAKQQEHYSAIMYNEEHYKQLLESTPQGQTAGCIVTGLTLLAAAGMSYYNKLTPSEPGKKLNADSILQNLVTCIQATFTETGATGIATLLMLVMLIVHEIGLIRLLSIQIFETETTVDGILDKVHWGLQFYVLTYVATFVLLVIMSSLFQRQWRAANFIRQNQRDRIHREFCALRPNRSPLVFWKQFENCGPVDGGIKLTYWTFEKLCNRFINQLDEFGAAKEHFDFAEYLCQRTTKAFVRVSAVNPLSTAVLLLMCVGIRWFLTFSGKWRLCSLPIIGVMVLSFAKFIMWNWQSMLHRYVHEPDTIIEDIKRFGKEAGARDGKSSFDVMVYSIRKFLRNLRPSTVSKERQELLMDCMNTLLTIFVFWLTMCLFCLRQFVTYAWPLLIPIILIYLLFLYFTNAMMYFCVLCTSCETSKDLAILQAVKTQQISLDSFSAMHMLSHWVATVHAAWSKADTLEVPDTPLEDMQANLSDLEVRQIKIIVSMLFGEHCERDSKGAEVTSSKWVIPGEVIQHGKPPKVPKDKKLSLEQLFAKLERFNLVLDDNTIHFAYPKLGLDDGVDMHLMTKILVAYKVEQVVAKISPKIKDVCDSVWKMLDATNEGELLLIDFKHQYENMVKNLDPNDKMLLLGSLDESGDGSIEQDEFLQWLAPLLSSYNTKYSMDEEGAGT